MFTAYMTPRPQWRLLNLVYLRMQLREPRIASFLLDWADADVADLAEQVDLGMLRAVRVDTDAPVRAVDLVAGELNWVRLSLTPPGVRWVRANPHNKVLHAIAHRHRPSVAAVLAAAQVDFCDLGVVIDAGLVTLTHGRFGMTPLSTSDAPAALTTAREEYFCALTPAGRGLIDLS
ncbi:hypothetical protein ABT297_11015 [Dactylosporangium sp. NPDC000555]|uniref:hypothetical protein n=1 Tax=Dactylosporangium sp. NPDC000555 TaxID=3154260 RepID=UPI00333022E2